MLEILGKEFCEPVVFCVRPDMGVEPGELVGGGTPQRQPQDCLGGVEHPELTQELLRFPAGLIQGEERRSSRRGRVTAATNSTMAWWGTRTESSAIPRRRTSVATRCFSGNRGSKR